MTTTPQAQITGAKCRKIAEMCVEYRAEGMGVLEAIKRVAVETHNTTKDVKRAVTFCLMRGEEWCNNQ